MRPEFAFNLLLCTLTIPALTYYGPASQEFGIHTKAECEARLKREVGTMLGYYGEHPHCSCSDDRPTASDKGASTERSNPKN
jgi:hypothetical protein